MNKSDKITIDPETFARTILAGNPKSPDEDKGVRTKTWTSGMMSLCIQKQTRKELSSSTTNIIIHGVQ
jgi:hypothetical protein